MNDERKKWLDSLEVGNVAAVLYGYRPDSWVWCRVIKISPSRQITVEFKDKGQTLLFRSEGSIRGSGRWDGRTELVPLTQDMVEERTRKNRLYRIKNFKFDDLDFWQVDQVLELLESFNKKEVDENAQP